jgi:hypothetical protein
MNPSGVDFAIVSSAPSHYCCECLLKFPFGLVNLAIDSTGFGGIEDEVADSEALLAESSFDGVEVVDILAYRGGLGEEEEEVRKTNGPATKSFPSKNPAS